MKKALFALLLLAACKKEQSNEATSADKAKAIEIQTWLSGKSFRLASYYADAPVIYPPGTTPETELWKYVSLWLHDDSCVFQNGNVLIYQNTLFYPEDNSPILSRPFDVAADKKGIYVDFLSFQYQPLRYDFVQKNDSTITLKYPYKGANVLSVFKKL